MAASVATVQVPPSPLMMTDEDLQALQTANGADASRLFLEQMRSTTKVH